jgi:hypothetical protein
MGLERVTYVKVFCDYPDHGPIKAQALNAGESFHQLITNSQPDLVICEKCWDNKMIVEDLLKLVGVTPLLQKVKSKYSSATA